MVPFECLPNGGGAVHREPGHLAIRATALGWVKAKTAAVARVALKLHGELTLCVIPWPL